MKITEAIKSVFPGGSNETAPAPVNMFAPAIDRLPEKARNKYFKIESEADAAREVYRGLHKKLTAAQEQLAEHKTRRAHLINSIRDESNPSILQINSQIKKSMDEIQRINSEISTRQNASRSILEIHSAIETYLNRSLPAGIIESAPEIIPSLKKGESHAAAIERTRREIAEAKETRFEIENAPLPASIAKEMARREIDQLAERGRPNVRDLVEGRERMTWPMTDRLSGAGSQHLHGAALTAWLHRDRLIEAIEKEIDSAADDESALTDSERRARLREIDTKIFELELTEETLIEIAHVEGATIVRRPDADPRSVLQITPNAPAPRA